MKVLILGATGMFGEILSDHLRRANYDVYCYSRRIKKNFVTFDLYDYDFFKNFLKNNKIKKIINLIAFTDVEKCELEKNNAFEANVKIPKLLSLLLSNFSDVDLIHISTDHIYSKYKKNKEENYLPINYYGFTKLLGEKEYDSSNVLILRTNFYGRTNSKIINKKQSFSEWVINTLQSNETLFGFNDVFFNPLDMRTLSDILLFLLNNFSPGVYNCGSKNIISKYKFCQLIAKKFKLDCSKIISISYCDFAKKYNLVQRPLLMGMDVTKFENKFNIHLPTLQNDIKNNYEEF